MIVTNKYNINLIANVKPFTLNIPFTRQPTIPTNQTLFLLTRILNGLEGTTLLKPERKLQHD